MIKVPEKLTVILEILGHAMINAVILVFLAEIINRGDIINGVLWVIHNGGLACYNILIVFTVYIFVLSICKNYLFSTILSCVFYGGISVINYFEVLYKGVTFSVTDLRLAREAINIMGALDLKWTSGMRIASGIAVMYLIFHKRKKVHMRMGERFICGVSAMACFILLMSFSNSYIVQAEESEEAIWELSNKYDKYGCGIGFLASFIPQFEEPEDYTKDNIKEIVDKYNKAQEASCIPNIIFVMNEAFYPNITALVDTNAEVTPNIDKYMKEFSSGAFLSPMYGGGTCQVEYEVMYGYPVSNTGSYLVYPTLIHGEVESMVSQLNENGYYTTAVHPYSRDFYHRDRVYSYMGFDDMIFREDMSSELEEEGRYIGDKNTYDELIRLYESKEDGVPFFSYVVTMQNHINYDYDYDKWGIYIKESKGGYINTDIGNTYLNLLRESDESLKYLIEYFEKIKEPTIIVFFGDHAPPLSGFGVEQERVMDLSKEYGETMDRQTPLLIWDNYGLPRENLGVISAYKVGAKVLDLAGLCNDAVFQIALSDDLPSYSLGDYLVGGKVLKQYELPDSMKTVLDELWLLQYDRMFGKGYSLP